MTTRRDWLTLGSTAAPRAQRPIVLLYQADPFLGGFADFLRGPLAPGRELRITDWQRGGAPLLQALIARHRGHVIVGAAAPDFALVFGECARSAGASQWYSGVHHTRRTVTAHRLHCLPHDRLHPVASDCDRTAIARCEDLFSGAAIPTFGGGSAPFLAVLAEVVTAVAREGWQPARAASTSAISSRFPFDFETFIYAS